MQFGHWTPTVPMVTIKCHVGTYYLHSFMPRIGIVFSFIVFVFSFCLSVRVGRRQDRSLDDKKLPSKHMVGKLGGFSNCHHCIFEMFVCASKTQGPALQTDFSRTVYHAAGFVSI